MGYGVNLCLLGQFEFFTCMFKSTHNPTIGQNNIDKLSSNFPLTCAQAGKIPGSFFIYQY